MTLQVREVNELTSENANLRELLDLRPRLTVPAQAAQVVYESPDIYTRRVVVDKGQVAGVAAGSPVMGGRGVLGQVTRVHPFTSEVTLLVDRNQAIPVMVERSGVRSVAYGDASNLRADGMELRFVSHDADVQEGDVLVTSGVDGVYPAGLPVAKVVKVQRRSDSTFSRIECEPLARMMGARHVMVLTPLDDLKAAEHPELELPTTEAADIRTREDKSAQRRAGASQHLMDKAGGKETAP
jgi:rod shape-determining protein MreC